MTSAPSRHPTDSPARPVPLRPTRPLIRDVTAPSSTRRAARSTHLRGRRRRPSPHPAVRRRARPAVPHTRVPPSARRRERDGERAEELQGDHRRQRQTDSIARYRVTFIAVKHHAEQQRRADLTTRPRPTPRGASPEPGPSAAPDQTDADGAERADPREQVSRDRSAELHRRDGGHGEPPYRHPHCRGRDANGSLPHGRSPCHARPNADAAGIYDLQV